MVTTNERYTVVLLDDEKSILRTLTRLLRPLNFNIHSFTQGQQALAFLAEQEVDLVISDMRMPEMDGAEFLAQVVKKSPSTMRILLTGFSDIVSTIKAINQGKIFAYICKPWDDQSLQETVTSALNIKKSLREKKRLEIENQQQKMELQQLNQNLAQQVQAQINEIKQTSDFMEGTYQELQQTNAHLENLLIWITKHFEGKSAKLTTAIAKLTQQIGLAMQLPSAYIQSHINAVQIRSLLLLRAPEEMSEINFFDTKPIDLERQNQFVVALKKIENLSDVANIIATLYERYDGRGKPEGKRGEEIPLGTRIIAVATAFIKAHQENSNVSNTLKLALEKVRRQAELKLDPAIVSVLDDLLRNQAEDLGQTQNISTDIQNIAAKDVAVGMVLAQDLKMPNGKLLLGKGQAVTKMTVKHLHELEQSTGLSISVATMRQHNDLELNNILENTGIVTSD